MSPVGDISLRIYGLFATFVSEPTMRSPRIMPTFTLPKAERLHSKRRIDALFLGGAAKSFSIYPLRVVYLPLPADSGESTSILISVSKRRFKHAVDRNRVKRQLREAYRLHKHLLASASQPVHIAFLYLSEQIVPTQRLMDTMQTALQRLTEKLSS